MADFDKKELKKIANELKPQFNIGKNGIGEGFIESIDNFLEAHNIVKIKVMVAKDKDELENYASNIAEKTESEVIDKRGFTFVLFRD
jgi:RNA-binding protein